MIFKLKGQGDRRPANKRSGAFLASSESKLPILLLLATLSSPFFSVGDAGFAGVALVDVFILLGLLGFLFKLLVNGAAAVVVGKYISIASLGLAFSSLAWFSLVFIPSGFDPWDFLVVLVQYFFLMTLLPIVASGWINERNIDRFFLWVGVAYLIPMIISLYIVFFGAGFLRDAFFSAERAIGTYGNANVYAAIIVLILPIYVLFLTKSGVRRFIGGAGFLLALINLVLTASYGGAVLAVLITLFGLFWAVLHGKLGRLAIRSFAILLFLALGFVAFLSSGGENEFLVGRVAERIEHVADDRVGVEQLGSASVRLGLISEGWQWVTENNGAIIGHGLGQSWWISEYGQNIHMLYLLLWVEGGFSLLVVYVAFMFFLFRNAIQLSRINYEAGTLVMMGLFTLLCFGFLNPHMYLRFFWWPVLPAFFSWHRSLR